MIVLRGVQGIGGAMVFGNSLAIVTSAFPASQRGRAVGAFSDEFSSLEAMLAPPWERCGSSAPPGWLVIHLFCVLPIGGAGVVLAFT